MQNMCSQAGLGPLRYLVNVFNSGVNIEKNYKSLMRTVLANIEVGISVCGHLISSYSFAVFSICRLCNCISVILSRELPSVDRILSSEVKSFCIAPFVDIPMFERQIPRNAQSAKAF